MTDGYGWKAHLHEGAAEWARGTMALTIFRRLPDGRGEQVVGWDNFIFPITEKVADGATLRPGFTIPKEAIESLTEQLKPGPTQRELDQLKEALDVERARVDAMLERKERPALEDFGGDEARQGVELLDRDAVRAVARHVADAAESETVTERRYLRAWAKELHRLAGEA